MKEFLKYTLATVTGIVMLFSALALVSVVALIGMVCFYILLCVLGANTWLAVAGAIAYAFASYNIIILEAGHITKAYVIAYMPLTLAGMALLFKGKWLWGGIVTILGVALSVKNGHIQITYYLALLCLAVYAGYVADRLRRVNPLIHMAFEDVDVGAADAAIFHGDGHFAGTGNRVGNLPALDSAGADVLSGSHFKSILHWRPLRSASYRS